MFRKTQILLVSASAIGLAACTTPFGTSTTDIKWDASPSAGTITVSDPKIYRREALINERRDERKWLDKLLEDSKTIPIKPEIIREIEVISAFSAGLGLKFDPAAGQTFTRNEETNDLRQQINVMRIQLELDQLRRDAELVRANFADQAAPANENLGQLGNTDLVANPGVTAAAAAEAFATLKSTIESLTSRLGATVNQPQLANASVNPIDEFRDRQAYRDILKTARNAASLDEQHDLDGNALLRLNFQATTLPGHKTKNVPGVVQVKLTEPELGDNEIKELYAGWLSYINGRLNIVDGEEIIQNPALLAAAAWDNFDIIYYDYPAKNSTAEQAANCSGFRFGVEFPADANPQKGSCRSLVFAVPSFNGSLFEGGQSSTFEAYLTRFSEGQDAENERAFSPFVRQALRNPVVVENLTSGCMTNLETSYRQTKPRHRVLLGRPTDEELLRDAIRTAQIRVAAASDLVELDRKARLILLKNNVSVRGSTSASWLNIRNQYREALTLLDDFEKAAFREDKCGDKSVEARQEFRKQLERQDLPETFRRAVTDPDASVLVYDVAPREQAQQISTVARSANSLGLALSLAASDPSSGTAANLASQYVRQATGKVATLERAPAVVGYSMGDTSPSTPQTSRTFGWVLGPQATIHPKKGRLDLEQTLKPYDLSADISVPGWWPQFHLEVVTKWAPEIDNVTRGIVTDQSGEGLNTTDHARHHTVKRAINDADYDALTTKLTRLGSPITRTVELDPFSNLTLSYCQATTIHAKGRNIWRTHAALILGKEIGSDAITVSPDMSGVFLTIPSVKSLVYKSGKETTLTIFTPSGSDFVKIKPEAETDCEPEKKKADPDAITATKVTADTFKAGKNLNVSVSGTNLDKIEEVWLAGGNRLTIDKSATTKTSMVINIKGSQTGALEGEHKLTFKAKDTEGKLKQLDIELAVQITQEK